MTATLAALAPVFGLIVLGAVLRPIGEDGWRGIELITYWLLLPALLVLKLGGTDLTAYEISPMVAVLFNALPSSAST